VTGRAAGAAIRGQGPSSATLGSWEMFVSFQISTLPFWPGLSSISAWSLGSGVWALESLVCICSQRQPKAAKENK